MGGNAFNLLHPEANFPRMKPEAYEHLKNKLHGALKELYANVATPREAPEKPDYGDIDFIVHGPQPGLLHEDIERALGSKWSAPAKGDHGTGNFAIPASSFESLTKSDEDDYYQVDVHICSQEDDFHKVVFFHGYGDLGMILGLMARSVGLSINYHGLRLARPLPTYPPISLPLSSSFDTIMPFFGLSLEKWEQGFTTQREIFDWVASSPYFNARRMARSEVDHLGRRKAREGRGMYQNFITYANESVSKPLNQPRRLTKDEIKDATQEAALVFFKKKELYDELLHVARVKQQVKAVFTGKLVMQWTGLQGLPVRWVMDEVHKRLGGEGPGVGDGGSPSVADDLAKLSLANGGHGPAAEEISIRPSHLTLTPWERKLEGMSIEDVQALVVQVKEEMYENRQLEDDWRERKRLKAEKKTTLETSSSSVE